jgi:hypothetical protein
MKILLHSHLEAYAGHLSFTLLLVSFLCGKFCQYLVYVPSADCYYLFLHHICLAAFTIVMNTFISEYVQYTSSVVTSWSFVESPRTIDN